jgi:hypothetical protein
VTTGQLLCACVGSQLRAEYTAFGDAINLSARLMVKAQSAGLGEVLCDFRTHELAKGAASFEALTPLQIKVGFLGFRIFTQLGECGQASSEVWPTQSLGPNCAMLLSKRAFAVQDRWPPGRWKPRGAGGTSRASGSASPLRFRKRCLKPLFYSCVCTCQYSRAASLSGETVPGRRLQG